MNVFINIATSNSPSLHFSEYLEIDDFCESEPPLGTTYLLDVCYVEDYYGKTIFVKYALDSGMYNCNFFTMITRYVSRIRSMDCEVT